MTGKSALILVAGFGFILSYISLNISKIGKMSNHSSSLYYESEVAHNLAIAGAQVGLSKVFQDTAWYGPPIHVDMRPYNIPGEYTVERDGPLIRSTSKYQSLHEELQYSVTVYLAHNANQSFSLFAWMTNSENGVQWISGDTVWGRVHTNDLINVTGSPTFIRKVTTVHGFNANPGTSPNEGNFAENWETGVDSVIFPASLSELLSAANDSSSGGRHYATDIWVTLNPGNPAVSGDGKVYVRQTQGGAVIDSILLDPGIFNGVILGDHHVNVHGTLDGRLTIASNDQIFIQDNILYQDDPRVLPSSDDMLGLVAEGSIIVADNTENQTDCVIHASIFSRADSFKAEDYDNGVLRGTLTLLGSIVQNRRGPVGTHSGGVINSGYLKRYSYDERLANPNIRPPFYPSFWSRTFPVTGWWETYHLPNYGKFDL